jgi:predicted Zn-dependent protease
VGGSVVVTSHRGMWAKKHRVLAGMLVAAMLAGCSSTGNLSPQLLAGKDPKEEMSPAALREHERILAAYGGAYNDIKLEAAISKTVDKLVAASDRPGVKYRVTVLNSPAINAFALPGGQLYVTRGLIALANDRAELASVLSHEMAHVIASHAAIREDQARRVALVEGVVNHVLSDPETGALALAKSKIALASFSRSQEFEADGVGVEISARAGFDPYGAERFLTSMGRHSELRPVSSSNNDSRPLDFLSSHPGTPDRVQNAVTHARQHSAPGSGECAREDHLANIDGLVFGEDPSEGFVRGRRYLHPKLGFTFMAPEGFILENTAQAVLGAKEGGAQAMRLDVVRVPAEQTLTDYLKSGWIGTIDDKSVEPVTINGFPAATATAKGDQWLFRLYAVRFGSEVYRFIFATKHKSAESERAFRDSINSFRRMTLAEIDGAKPLRIKVVTVTPSDTPERLAARMAIPDRPLQRFLVLNGLTPGQALKPGDQVKIVTE